MNYFLKIIALIIFIISYLLLSIILYCELFKINAATVQS